MTRVFSKTYSSMRYCTIVPLVFVVTAQLYLIPTIAREVGGKWSSLNSYGMLCVCLMPDIDTTCSPINFFAGYLPLLVGRKTYVSILKKRASLTHCKPTYRIANDIQCCGNINKIIAPPRPHCPFCLCALDDAWSAAAGGGTQSTVIAQA